MKLNSFNKVVIIALLLSFSACQSEYTKLVKSELSSNKQNNSIFHDLEFGQTRSDFYEICWGLNKRGIATHGPSNNYVQTFLEPKDTTQTLKKIRMLFYAKFNERDIITAMDVKFSYSAWAPWNKEMQGDKLLPIVQDTLMKWYPGNPFMKVKNALVKVDGNRQIKMFQESERDVSVLIEDLEYKYNTLVK
ncbi:hypothetical protein OE09_2624 [Flavobacteriaceae bacterium MAR_2010_72]|nr:hypothetical protein OE09_2624 [Flavobacteriaceae bacterium MAR_2010_72]